MVAAALGLLALASAPPLGAQPQPTEAETHFRLGTSLHGHGRFSEAAGEFLTAWRLSRHPDLLYNAYVAYRDAADTRRAADALRQYLDVQPRARNRAMLEAQLAAMEAQLRAAPTPATPVASAPPTPPPPATPAVTPGLAARPAARPTVRPTVGPRRSLALPVALVAGGGVAIVAGAVLGVTVLATGSDLAAACPGRVCDPSLRADADSGRTRAVVTDVLLGAGLASAAAGVVLLLTSRGGAPGPTAGAACVPGACGARLRVTF